MTVSVDGGRGGCAVCCDPTTTRCSACKIVYYCSQTCQKRHWVSEHKTKCKGSSNKLKAQQQTVGKRDLFIALVPSNGPVYVDKVLFPYNEFVKLFNWDVIAFPPRGLLNIGNSCFANVAFQCLAHTRPLVAYLLKKGHRRYCRRNKWCFRCEFESHLYNAFKSEQPFSPINILSQLPTMGGNMRYGKQEDAHEFMRFAIEMMQSECLDEHGGEELILPKSQETTLIQHIFGGQLQSQVKCTRCSQASNQYENMMDLTVEIQGDATSLEECLNQFTAVELLYGENKYKCDKCNDYVVARKRLTIHQPPNILTVALKRFQGGIFGKINKKITFPETLVLSPYMTEEKAEIDKYELYAVVVHMDMLNASFFGHYVCYTKGSEGEWYSIDDSKVTKVELDDVLSQGAYMLLYRRICARPKCLKTSEDHAATNKEHESNVSKPSSDIKQEMDRDSTVVDHSLRVGLAPVHGSSEDAHTRDHVSDPSASDDTMCEPSGGEDLTRAVDSVEQTAISESSFSGEETGKFLDQRSREQYRTIDKYTLAF